MSIAVQHSPAAGGYGKALAGSAKNEQLMTYLMPLIQQYQQQGFQSSETEKQRQFEGSQSSMDRALQEAIAKYQGQVQLFGKGNTGGYYGAPSGRQYAYDRQQASKAFGNYRSTPFLNVQYST